MEKYELVKSLFDELQLKKRKLSDLLEIGAINKDIYNQLDTSNNDEYCKDSEEILVCNEEISNIKSNPKVTLANESLHLNHTT